MTLPAPYGRRRGFVVRPQGASGVAATATGGSSCRPLSAAAPGAGLFATVFLAACFFTAGLFAAGVFAVALLRTANPRHRPYGAGRVI